VKKIFKILNSMKTLMILNTLSFSAPTMWLLLNIYDGNTENILRTSILSLIGIILIIINWVIYFKFFRNEV
jgi:hypothetical protein